MGIHQVLVFFTFNLDHTHDNSINHVHRLAFIFFTVGALLVAVHLFDTLLVLIVSLHSLVVEVDVVVTFVVIECASFYLLLNIIGAGLESDVVRHIVGRLIPLIVVLLVILWLQMVRHSLLMLLVHEVIHATVSVQISLLWLGAQTGQVVLQTLVVGKEDWVRDRSLSLAFERG